MVWHISASSVLFCVSADLQPAPCMHCVYDTQRLLARRNVRSLFAKEPADRILRPELDKRASYVYMNGNNPSSVAMGAFQHRIALIDSCGLQGVLTWLNSTSPTVKALRDSIDESTQSGTGSAKATASSYRQWEAGACN